MLTATTIAIASVALIAALVVEKEVEHVSNWRTRRPNGRRTLTTPGARPRHRRSQATNMQMTPTVAVGSFVGSNRP
jgi:hypothetical protein